jgi:hypothetical protein
METKQDPRGPVLLVAFMIVLHAKLCLSMIVFHICVLAPREDVQGSAYYVVDRGGR